MLNYAQKGIKTIALPLVTRARIKLNVFLSLSHSHSLASFEDIGSCGWNMPGSCARLPMQEDSVSMTTQCARVVGTIKSYDGLEISHVARSYDILLSVKCASYTVMHIANIT
jgi:hypothetical protein